MSERIAPEVSRWLAAEIRAAGGREVSFLALVDGAGMVTAARVLARGTVDTVLALASSARRGELLLHNHPSGFLEPSAADLHVASGLHDAGIGMGIINDDASELYVVVEVPQERSETAIDPLAVAAALGEGGPVARALGRYEDRPPQRDMAAYIADGYNDGGVALIEAGTGVGKSFAYLVPALAWAGANHERTVVSTNTINLQEQLVGKDLPFLARALATPEHTPTFALLKGWNNYLCLARLEAALRGEQALFEEDRLGELHDLAAWGGGTADGTRSDLPAPVSPEVWEEVQAESDLCPRLKCPHFDRCFLFRARRRAADADVVVVNHHLLAMDLNARAASGNWDDAAVLPPYRRLILDEAHHLEDVAAKHLGVGVSGRGVRRLLARLERRGRGLIPALARELAGRDDQLSRASLKLLRHRLIPAASDAGQATDALFARLLDRVEREPGGQLRLDRSFAADPVWEEGLAGELNRALLAWRALREQVETIADRLWQVDDPERRTPLLQELRAVIRRLDAVSDGLTRTLGPVGDGPAEVRWLERSRGRHRADVALAAVPLDLAPVLRERLFDRLRTVVLTSATLAASGDFGFLESRLGLAGDDSPVTIRELLPSPFDFPSQCVFGVATDLPEPREDAAAHSAAIARAVDDLAWASDGGILVLFTAHAVLREVAAELRRELDPRWPLLVQDGTSRDRLLQRFREAGNAILLGTDSFWEGVDVPGRALRALVLTKLPFKVPTEPLTAARMERLQEEGRDGFMDYLLPHAALKLKQGFGRLIRSRSDAGVVILLDRRAVTRPYGRLMLEGLPRATQVLGSWAEVRTRCEDFFARFGLGAAP